MNQRRTLLIAGLASVATLAGCAGPQVSDYVRQKPLLELER